MYHEIPSPEQAAELAAWWRQAFEALERSVPRRVGEGSPIACGDDFSPCGDQPIASADRWVAV